MRFCSYRVAIFFCKKPFKEDDRTEVKPDGTKVIKLGCGVYTCVNNAFLNMKKLSTDENFLHRESECVITVDETEYNVRFIFNDVIHVWYLDVIVEGKSKAKCIKCLEMVQDKI